MRKGERYRRGLDSFFYYIAWLVVLVLLSVRATSLLGIDLTGQQLSPVLVYIIVFFFLMLVFIGLLVVDSIDPRTSIVLASLGTYWFWKVGDTLITYVLIAVVVFSIIKTLADAYRKDKETVWALVVISVPVLIVIVMLFTILIVVPIDTQVSGTPLHFSPDVTLSVGDVNISMEPSISVDDEDVVHAVWTEGDVLSINTSRVLMYANLSEGGWSQAFPLSSPDEDASGPRITFGLDSLHVVWLSYDNVTNKSRVLHREMTDGNWSVINTVSDPAASVIGHPSAAASSSGRLHTVWSQRVDVSDHSAGSVILYRSLDGGIWDGSEAINIANGNHSHSPTMIAKSYYGAEVAWFETDGSLGYSVYHRSLLFGGWGTTSLVNQSDGVLPPSLSLSSHQSYVDIVWQDCTGSLTNKGTSKLNHAYGKTSEGFQMIDQHGSLMTYSSQPSIFHDDDGNLHLTWREVPTLSGSKGYITYKMIDRFNMVRAHSAISQSSDYEPATPAVVVDSKMRVHVVWQESYSADNASSASRVVYTASSHVPDMRPPTAVAGANIHTGQGDKVTLDGSNSSDNIGIVNHTWSFRHDDQDIMLYGERPNFTFYVLGEHEVTLRVRDAAGNGDVDTMSVTVNDTVAPHADAGADQQRSVVRFDGSGSHDDMIHIGSGIDNLTWTFNDGVDDVTLFGNSPTHRFTVIGDFLVTLNVTDVAGNHAEDVMWVNVSDVSPPVAVAGGDVVVDQDTVVTFNGSASTDDVNITFWQWRIVEDVGITTLNGMTQEHTFRSVGDFEVTLTVWDAAGNDGNDTITVTVVDSVDPVANAGGDTLQLQGNVVLNASESHDDAVGVGSGIANYTWTITRGNVTQTWYGMEASPTLEQPGTYSVNLTVEDGVGRTAWDTVTLTIAYAGAPYSLQDAIDGALTGETILISSGEHQGDVVIDKPITLTVIDDGSVLLIGHGDSAVISILSHDVNITGLRISSDVNATGIHFMSVQGCNISSNILYGMGTGIFLNGSDDNILHGNRVNDTVQGVVLSDSENNTVQYNVLTGNGEGVSVTNSSFNTLRWNEILDNGVGMQFDGSQANLIHGNHFINNTLQAWDDGTNRWNLTAAEGGGNSWSDYNNTFDGDGYGVTAYAIEGGDNYDYAPLMTIQPLEEDNFYLYIGIATVATLGFTFFYGEALIEAIRKSLKGMGYYRKARKAERVLRKMEKKRMRE